MGDYLRRCINYLVEASLLVQRVVNCFLKRCFQKFMSYFTHIYPVEYNLTYPHF